MSGNERIIKENYEDAKREEGRFFRDRASGMEAYYTKNI
jgi:hypothetical protein